MTEPANKKDLPESVETNPLGYGEWPTGYWASRKKYEDIEFWYRMRIWKQLKNWRELAKKYPELKPELLLRSSSDERDAVKVFQNEILKAVFEADKDLLAQLIAAATSAEEPELDMHGVRAAHAAFRELFTGKTWKDWPTKGQVRRRAEEILKARGQIIPQKRAWTTIFRKAGLRFLLEDPPGRKRKSGS
jgi:hypothetical protein